MKLLILVLLFYCLIIFSICSGKTIAASQIVPNLNSINVLNGALEGSAYSTQDSSAINGYKISFGAPNKVSFIKGNPKIIIGAGNLQTKSQISSLDYGANEIWYDGGYGAQDLTNGEIYPSVINLVKGIGLNILRFPGGIPSDTFNWQNAIGPMRTRLVNPIYQSEKVFLPSNFGPDEFGKLINGINASGDITVNFGTSTAQAAANWVSYMTSPANTFWGKLRAKYGHPVPYNIPYWEVGNEQESSAGELYWRAGSLVKLNTSKSCNFNLYLCEYVYGGTTRFGNQNTLGSDNQTSSNGEANQTFYALYPPIVTGSQTVYVNGTAWYRVNNFDSYGPTSRVYELNNTSGEIIFGNGVHGAIPPINTEITISYQSGPHDGFITYYNLMKSANPKIKVCSSYDSPNFMSLMGSNLPYDCIVSHLYAGNVPSTNVITSYFHDNLIEQSDSFNTILTNEQNELNKYAGIRAKNISIAVTEYGVNALTNPAGQPDYHRSQDLALFVANTLIEIIKHHIPLAEKHYLISYENTRAPNPQIYINGETFSNNALVAGPGPNAYLQPSGYAIELFSKLLYGNLINSKVLNNPLVVSGGSSYSGINEIATTDGMGHEAILAINLSSSSSYNVKIIPAGGFKKVDTYTLGANNYLAFNSPSDPSNVSIINQTSKLKNGELNISLPASSITVMQFK